DRFLTWGGGLYNTGGSYVMPSESNPSQLRQTGPYLFDPSKADGNKVGGTTGSAVDTTILGGNMWANRDVYKNLAGQMLPPIQLNGCIAYTQENNHDVMYVAASTQTQPDLYRYELVDIGFPALDLISKVGIYWVGTSGATTCGYDSAKKLFVRTGNNTSPFLFWDLTVPGLSNIDKRVDVTFSVLEFKNWLSETSVNLKNCSLAFDPVRDQYLIWCGTGVVWTLQSPAANTTYGWTATQLPLPTTAVPPGNI